MFVEPVARLTIAEGNIGPEGRSLDPATLSDMRARMHSGEFYVSTAQQRPNAAGGTLSLVIGDALTSGRFRRGGEAAKDHARRVYIYLQKHHDNPVSRTFIPAVCIDGRLPVEGSPENPAVIGGHDDERGPDGCGAQKHLEKILGYIHEHGGDIRQFLAERSIMVDDTMHHMLVSNAAKLIAENYVSSGVELRQALVDVGGEACVTTLVGEHNEAELELNTEDGATLSREKLHTAFGGGYQAFNADVAALKKTADALSLTPAEAQQKFAAMLYYNLATAAVLAAPSLPVDVR